VKSKYDDILEIFKEELPDTEEEAKVLSKSYHLKTEMTKTILSTKLKNIRLRYRKAVDMKNKSGQGRVVYVHYDICAKIWGGRPATEQMNSGIETDDILIDDEEDDNITTDTTNTAMSSVSEEQQDTVTQRRALMSNTFKNYRQTKLKRKAPIDAQLLTIAKEELDMKKRMVEEITKADQQHSTTAAQLSSNIIQLSNAISEGFKTRRNLLQPSQLSSSYMTPIPPTGYYGSMYTGMTQTFLTETAATCPHTSATTLRPPVPTHSFPAEQEPNAHIEEPI
jgi:hypothetical protein